MCFLFPGPFTSGTNISRGVPNKHLNLSPFRFHFMIGSLTNQKYSEKTTFYYWFILFRTLSPCYILVGLPFLSLHQTWLYQGHLWWFEPVLIVLMMLKLQCRLYWILELSRSHIPGYIWGHFPEMSSWEVPPSWVWGCSDNISLICIKHFGGQL